MALNNLGLGLTFTAEDLASAVIQQLGSEFQQLDHAAEGTKLSMVELAEGMEKAGTALAALGVAGGIFFGMAEARAHSMEEALRLVSTRVDEATFPMEHMEELASELAVQFGSLPVEQARAMFQAVSDGAKTAAESENLLTAANQLAKASNTSLEGSIEAISQALHAYGMGFEHAEDVADAFFLATKNANTSVTELGAMLEHFGPMAARAGIGMEQVLAAVSALGQAGVRGRPALSGLRAIIETFVQPSKEAVAEAQRLGIAFNAATIKSKGMAEMLREITSSARFNKDTLEKMFGSMEAGTAVLALMRNGGKGLNESLEAIAHGEGAAAAAAEKLITPGMRLQALKEKALILIGQALVPLVEAVQRVGVVILTVFNAIPKPIIQAFTLFGVLTAAIFVIAGSATAAAGAFMLMDGALLPIIAGMGVALGVAIALGAALLFIGGPVALALFGLKLAFEENLGGIRDELTELWAKVKLVYEGLTQLFEEGGFSGAVRKELDKASNAGLKQFVIEVFMWGSRIREFFVSAGQAFEATVRKMGPVFTELKEAFHQLGDAITKLFGGENDPQANAAKWDTFAGAGRRVGEALAGLVKWAAEAVTYVVNLGTAIAQHLALHEQTFRQLGDAAVAVVHAVGALVDAFMGFQLGTEGSTSALDVFAAGISSWLAGDARLLVTLLGEIATYLEHVAAALRGGAATWNAFRANAVAAIDQIKGPLNALADLIDRISDKLGIGREFLRTALMVPNGLGGEQGAAAPLGGAGLAPGASGGPRPGAGVTEAPTPRGGPVVAAVATQASAAGGGGGMASEVAAAVQHGLANAPGTQVTLHAPIMLDSEKIGEAVAAKQAGGKARAFEPSPMPG